jgi:hypothetical protein
VSSLLVWSLTNDGKTHFLSGLEVSATSVCTKTVDCGMQHPYWTSRLVMGRGFRELDAAEEAIGEDGASL